MTSNFHRLDFQEIDEFDPSLLEGHRVLYDREIMTHVRFQDRYNECRDMPHKEAFNVRVLQLVNIITIQQGTDLNPTSLRIEVFCDNDLFFAYFMDVNLQLFEKLKLQQRFDCAFNEFAKMLILAFNSCVEGKCKPTYTMLLDGTGKMEIIQQNEFKNIHMLTLDFEVYNDDFIKQRVQQKYLQVRKSVNALQSRQQQISHQV